MAKMVRIRVVEPLAGLDFSLAAGHEYDVDEEVAKARVAAGLAEYVDEPAARSSVRRGTQQAETATKDEPERR